MAVSSGVQFDRPGAWQVLFPKALELMANVERHVENASWTFGGGTMLMLRFAHRHSKDIDLFVPDPQYLGYVTPRLSEVAETITTEYEENAEFVKLYLPDGEIDIVVGESLTEHPFEAIGYGNRKIKVETAGEIIAKKMWHRGGRAKARDLYDLCAVVEHEPEQIEVAKPFMKRHASAFLRALDERHEILTEEFRQIDTLGVVKSYEDCRRLAREILEPLIEAR
ncbi:MAG: nucleotidyl transferase AbiEii/AbiGii toxin family protein [Proteobacteria bacterium]|nr:nucleotidyl transferase AbiEii/AbiGii toxin family protein [Pseudomonadota bacterium]